MPDKDKEYQESFDAWKLKSCDERVAYVERYARLAMDMMVDGYTDEAGIMCDVMYSMFLDMKLNEIKGAITDARSRLMPDIPPTDKQDIKHN